MPDCPSLLPPNATAFERNAEQSACRMVDIEAPHASLWNADTCPVQLLPWLAWALSVGGWDSELSETAKRLLIKQQMRLKRIVGCEESMIAALTAAGFPGIKIIEANQDAILYNGSASYDGLNQHGYGGHWAQYWLIMTAPIANHLAPLVRRIARRHAPVRCQLVQMVYTGVAYSYNATIGHDGSYNYGAA